MLTLAPTHDLELVRQIAIHPKLWPHVSDDFAPEPEDWRPAETDRQRYLLIEEGDSSFGFFALVEHSPVLWEVHTCLLPAAWGGRANLAAGLLVSWTWENTHARRLVTTVPANNRLALRFAKRAGMTEFGRNPQAYLKNGTLTDLILLGLSRPAA